MTRAALPFKRRALFTAIGALAAACGGGARAAVPLRFNRVKGTPPDAGVWIDEEFVGPLSIVAAHGFRLPEGEHRISIQKEGYFPWDRQVVAGREPLFFDVSLQAVPD